MGPRYLIDSNIIIDYSAGVLPSHASDFCEQIFNSNFIISTVVKIEVLGYNHIPDKLVLMTEFIDSATVLPLNEDVVQQTILLRRKYRKIKLGDAIIAATAIIHKLTLVTRNTVDFENIKGLSFINPWNNL